MRWFRKQSSWEFHLEINCKWHIQHYTAKWRPARFEECKRAGAHCTDFKKSDYFRPRRSCLSVLRHERNRKKPRLQRSWARAVNCEHPVDGSPCNECAVCRSILEGRSVNVAEIDAASNKVSIISERFVIRFSTRRQKENIASIS